MSDALKITDNLEDVLEMIESGATLEEIGVKYSIHKSNVSRFLSQHPARAQESYKLSAQSLADEAIKVLKDDNVDIMRARELASHYRWEAKMRDRAKYGDKVELDNKQPIFTPDHFNQILEAARNNASISDKSE